MIQNKYIIRFSFLGLFVAILMQGLLYRYFIIENIILQSVVKNNHHIADTYYSQIWTKHQAITKQLEYSVPDFLIGEKLFIAFSEDSMEFFANTDLISVSLYNKTGQKFLVSNDIIIKDNDNRLDGVDNKIIYLLDKYFLDKNMKDSGLNSALSGISNFSISLNATVYSGKSNYRRRDIVSYYVPIIVDSRVVGALELVTDITDQWDKTSLLEAKVIKTFLAIFGVFFIVIMYNTHHTQKIINKQFEVNKLLEEAKNLAEGESSDKTQFLANVSHELRTPLNAIIGFSEMILSQAYGKIENAQYVEYIQDINNSGKHLLSVINDILDFSKAAADKLQVENIELDLNKLVTSSMRFVKPRAESSNVELIEILPREHVVITADPKRLKQVLLNLLTNAVKFTPNGGSVTLEVVINSLEKLVYIKVIDTGIGMSEKDIPKALTSFGQVDNKPNRQYEGTGLGLPLTKKLVELINGKFDITSQVGVGTIVTLTFEYIDSIDI